MTVAEFIELLKQCPQDYTVGAVDFNQHGDIGVDQNNVSIYDDERRVEIFG